jgi:G:T-mismatch repair DNA endonuclease (very short patch repair protein)
MTKQLRNARKQVRRWERRVQRLRAYGYQFVVLETAKAIKWRAKLAALEAAEKATSTESPVAATALASVASEASAAASERK